MTISEIILKVESVNTESNYWFVRTDYGRLFEDFYQNNFIAIGWDYLTLYDIRNGNIEAIKKKMADIEKVDLNTFSGKMKISLAYNKIQTFISLKKDDIIVMPSRNSDRLAFGRVDDDAAYEDLSVKEFIKRRKVEWYEIKSMEDLNPIFYKVKSNQHAISSINHYASHIDRVIGNLFKKGDNTHYVLKIDKTDDVNFDELQLLMDNIKILMQNINQDFGFNENTNEFYIKINLQSKGNLELIKKGKSLAVLAYLIFLTSCNNLDTEKDNEIAKFIELNKTVLKSTSVVIDTLKMNTYELTKPFNKNGN
ncbi:MAG: hypothetical protein NTZ33_15455 [Bacteroidetes bacterium]|nr:hypothetical protein [Bacteroidota bacterium]